MNNRVTPEIEKDLDALCRKISVGEGVDDELREELRGHMEDKFLAYKSGEEEVSDLDALILVREHFGDPKVVRGMLRDVHEYEADASFMRKLAALLVLFFAAHLIAHVGVLYSRRFISVLYMVPFAWPLLSAYVMAIHLCALGWWKARMNAGKMLWFQTMAPLRLFALVLGAAVFYYLLFPLLFCDKPGSSWELKSWVSMVWFEQRTGAVYLLHMFVLSFLWLRWLDAPSKKMDFAKLFGVALLLFGVAIASGLSWNLILYNDHLFITDNMALRILAYLGCCAMPAAFAHALSRRMRANRKPETQGVVS